MAVRNWWVEVEIDGRITKLAGGPRAKDGEFTLTIRQRNRGQLSEVLVVDGRVTKDDELQIWVSPRLIADAVPGRPQEFTVTTKR